MLALLLAAAALAADPAAAMLRALDPPPWDVRADETRLPDSPSFKVCDRLLAASARKTDEPASHVSRTLSPHWGWVVRAELTDGVRLTCWSPRGVGFLISVTPPPEAMFPPRASRVTVESITPPPPVP